jgi:hypothetical protein
VEVELDGSTHGCEPTLRRREEPRASPATTPVYRGDLIALDPPVNSPAARYTVDLSKLPGKGAGLLDAASKSPSLTVCDGDGGVVVSSSTDGGGVDVDGGIVYS